MKRHFGPGAIVLAGLWSVTAFAASNPYVGTWKKNVTESFGMSDPAGQETTVIRRHDTVLDYTWTGAGSTRCSASRARR